MHTVDKQLEKKKKKLYHANFLINCAVLNALNASVKIMNFCKNYVFALE